MITGSSRGYVTSYDTDASYTGSLSMPASVDSVAFLGGNDNDEAFDVAVHPGTGEVYVVGRTYGGFPAVDSPAACRPLNAKQVP